MPEPVRAVLVLWNDVDPSVVEAYEQWHAHEHVPERCTVPGILWGWRFARADAKFDANFDASADANAHASTRPAPPEPQLAAPSSSMPHYLTLYGLRDSEVLESEAYQRLLREPSAQSRRMRPALRRISRWVCRVVENSFERPPPWMDVAIGHEASAVQLRSTQPRDHLLLERLPNAAPLPWLQASQTLTDSGMPGDWLGCAGTGEGAPRELSAAVRYRSLPVGH